MGLEYLTPKLPIIKAIRYNGNPQEELQGFIDFIGPQYIRWQNYSLYYRKDSYQEGWVKLIIGNYLVKMDADSKHDFTEMTPTQVNRQFMSASLLFDNPEDPYNVI
jgi:hypothetical protein